MECVLSTKRHVRRKVNPKESKLSPKVDALAYYSHQSAKSGQLEGKKVRRHSKSRLMSRVS